MNKNFKNIFDSYLRLGFTKSLAAGGIAALSDLILLSVLVEIFHAGYWFSVNTSFVLAILINFGLQKYWVFGVRDMPGTHGQFLRFFLMAIFNLAANSALMYLFVDVLSWWYLVAQALAIALLAALNFAVYRNYVFKH